MSLEEFTSDVFLGYSSEDKAVVHAIAERLRADGVRVWLDAWEIRPGDVIPAKLEDGLEGSRVLVFCMSENAFGSDWARLEAGTFRFRDPLNTLRRFIPLRLDTAPIKGPLAQSLYIDWLPENREQAYAKLLEACRPPARQPEAEALAPKVTERIVQLDCKATIYTYAFSPDGKRALSGGNDNTERLWDLETGRCLCALEGHAAEIYSVVWSADHRRVLSGSWDKTLRLWDLETKRCLRVFKGHADNVSSVVWSADHRRALSGSWDRTVQLWDVETGECVRVLQGHWDSVGCFRPGVHR